ncbi:HET-domain-containing protein, partial [Trematosphaeria pertusa]
MDGLCHCVRPDLQKLGEDLYCLSCGYASLGKTENQHFKPEGPGNTVIHLTGRAKFHYRPLQSPHALRLVHLYAGHRKDEIRCRIFHATLEDHPVFEALSYTWGDSILSHEIYSDEGTVRVTANCASALRDLRHTSRDRFLWIDAICINQASNAEKNHQVPLMNKIYAAAIRVVIYIGPDPADDADRFFDYFRPHYLRPDSACMAARKIVDQDHVSAFLSKSWFSRIWVLQEVAVAREAVL